MSASVRSILALCALFSLISCGLIIDIPDDSGIRYRPGSVNQVLSETEIPHLCYDFGVNKSSVEALFCIKDAAGEIPGTYQWEDQTVSFRPQPELIPGRRYTFCFVGNYRDLRGIEYCARKIVPFYYVQRDESAPYLVSSVPPFSQLAVTEVSG